MHDISEDLHSLESDLQVAKAKAISRRAFVFDPDLEEERLTSLHLDAHRISDDQFQQIVDRV